MKIVFLGTPEFAVPILDALNKKYEVLLVVSQPNRAKKKNQIIETPVAKYAKENNLELFQPESIKDEADKIINLGADIMITAAYGQYIPSKILNAFKYKLNVHGSLLPKHRGGAPIQRCLMEGDEYTGVCIMEMAKKLDAGKVYSKAVYKIEASDNSTSLFNKLSILGRDLLIESLPDIVSGKNQGEAQDDTLATYSPNIDKTEEEININSNARDIINKIRGLADEPGAYINVNGTKLKIYKAEISNQTSNLKAGTILSTKKGITIMTKDFPINLLEVQMPGKNRISAKDFSNGQKIFVEGNVISSEIK
jgi:methionyl-tRNA formyltransferase